MYNTIANLWELLLTTMALADSFFLRLVLIGIGMDWLAFPVLFI
jgi:hypothetical protein